MKNILLLTFVLFMSSSNTESAEETRRVIELSIKRDAHKINDIIYDLNKHKVKGIDNSEALLKMYDLATETNRTSLKMVTDLKEIDSEINLKKEALAYLKLSHVFLKEGIKPVLTMSLVELQENQEVLITLFTHFKQFLATTQRMDEKINAFCNEHKLNKELTDFDKSIYDKKINEVQELFND